MSFDVEIIKTLSSPRRLFRLAVRFRSAAQRLVISGPSGAGKSLTLRAMAGLLEPDAGNIKIADRVLFARASGTNLPPQQRHVAYLFQDLALFPHLNVRQNIAFGLKRSWFNPGPREADAEVDRWLEICGLREHSQARPAELSGGQKQRAALARALILRPKAILLDEPFTALDPALRLQMRAELDRLQRQLGIPMVVVSHDIEDARQLGDELLCIEHGSIVPG